MAVTPSAAINTALDARSLIDQLQQIRRQPSAELDWNRYCELMRQLCKAIHCAVLQRLSEGDSLAQLGRAAESPTWAPLQTMPPGIDMLAKATAQGYAQAPIAGGRPIRQHERPTLARSPEMRSAHCRMHDPARPYFSCRVRR